MKVTVGIPTKNRYEALAICLSSVAMQTYTPVEVIIIDDSDNPIDLRTVPNFQYIFELFNYYKIDFTVLYGLKMGQHHSHQYIQTIAKGDWIWRIDDDEVAEPYCLEQLINTATTKDNVGAVGSLVLMPNPQPLPEGIPDNPITDLYCPNIQWFTWNGIKKVDHLNSTFLYKKGIANYNLELSPVAHREETLFSYEIKKAGYEVYVNGDARVWHFRQSSGGIRAHRDPTMYDWDEKIFQKKLREWGIVNKWKIIVLDCGMGDHWAFKHILPQLKKRYQTVVIAASYPDVFWDATDGIKLISIGEAKLMLGDIEEHNIYRKMIDWNWKGTLVEAFAKLYL